MPLPLTAAACSMPMSFLVLGPRRTSLNDSQALPGGCGRSHRHAPGCGGRVVLRPARQGRAASAGLVDADHVPARAHWGPRNPQAPPPHCDFVTRVTDGASAMRGLGAPRQALVRFARRGAVRLPALHGARAGPDHGAPDPLTAPGPRATPSPPDDTVCRRQDGSPGQRTVRSGRRCCASLHTAAMPSIPDSAKAGSPVAVVTLVRAPFLPTRKPSTVPETAFWT